jgi:hypothetical protein
MGNRNNTITWNPPRTFISLSFFTLYTLSLFTVCCCVHETVSHLKNGQSNFQIWHAHSHPCLCSRQNSLLLRATELSHTLDEWAIESNGDAEDGDNNNRNRNGGGGGGGGRPRRGVLARLFASGGGGGGNGVTRAAAAAAARRQLAECVRCLDLLRVSSLVNWQSFSLQSISCLLSVLPTVVLNQVRTHII